MKDFEIIVSKIKVIVKNINKSDNFVSFENHWPKDKDDDFKFIIRAERAAIKTISKKIGRKLNILGGSGTIGYREATCNIK